MSQIVRPITPDEAQEQAQNDMPGVVIEAFNTLITKYLKDGSATFPLHELMALIEGESRLNRNEIYDLGWLEIAENAFRAVGWEVVFDKPGHDESYASRYKFKRQSHAADRRSLHGRVSWYRG